MARLTAKILTTAFWKCDCMRIQKIMFHPKRVVEQSKPYICWIIPDQISVESINTLPPRLCFQLIIESGQSMYYYQN